MSVSISPIGGAAQQFFDNNGGLLSGGKIYTYSAGTTTPLASYTSSTGSTPHSNPIILDSAGRVPGGEIWLTNNVAYKFVIYTSLDILIGSYDNIFGGGGTTAPSVQRFNGTGAQTAFTLTTAPLSTSTTDVYVNGIYQQKNTYSVASTTLTFSEAPPLTSTIEVVYV